MRVKTRKFEKTWKNNGIYEFIYRNVIDFFSYEAATKA